MIESDLIFVLLKEYLEAGYNDWPGIPSPCDVYLFGMERVRKHPRRLCPMQGSHRKHHTGVIANKSIPRRRIRSHYTKTVMRDSLEIM